MAQSGHWTDRGGGAAPKRAKAYGLRLDRSIALFLTPFEILDRTAS